VKSYQAHACLFICCFADRSEGHLFVRLFLVSIVQKGVSLSICLRSEVSSPVPKAVNHTQPEPPYSFPPACLLWNNCSYYKDAKNGADVTIYKENGYFCSHYDQCDEIGVRTVWGPVVESSETKDCRLKKNIPERASR